MLPLFDLLETKVDKKYDAKSLEQTRHERNCKSPFSLQHCYYIALNLDSEISKRNRKCITYQSRKAIILQEMKAGWHINS